MEKNNLVEEQKMVETSYTLSSVFPTQEINDQVKEIICEKKEEEPYYSLSSVFPTKEINDRVKAILSEGNKILICQSLGLSEEEAKLLTWQQIDEMLENRKESNNRPKIFERLRQTRRRVS